ncbi:MAG: heavy metal translocating P-type ATPase metal-binding domain-containing protein [Undibacterium sp.]|nr:heavy metal translocating P-type ATPase metal-binding domain-containing protein [Undibacterium sp.]
MSKKRSLTIFFQNEERVVCCHACLAVLSAIEKTGLAQQYTQAKALL